MSSDTNTADETVWGAPQPGRKWTVRHTLSAVGVAAVIAVFGGVAIYAATSGSSNAMGPGTHGPGTGGFGPGGPGPGGPDGQDPHGLPEMGGPAPLHGEFVVAGENGGYSTELVQTGVLTAVSDTSITARSEDGFTQTYTLAPDSRTANAQLAVDDTVTIHATKVNGAATATTVAEGSEVGPGGPPAR